MLPFEFIILGPPVSQQTRRRERLQHWRARIRNAAESGWLTDIPLEQEITVEITYLFEGAPADVDNIIKPILDAMEGVVFKNDSQITDLIIRRRNIAGPYTIDSVSSILAEALANRLEFLHIRVTAASIEGELRFE